MYLVPQQAIVIVIVILALILNLFELLYNTHLIPSNKLKVSMFSLFHRHFGIKHNNG